MKINNLSEISLTIDYFLRYTYKRSIKNSKSDEFLESFDLSRERILFLRFVDPRLIKKGLIWVEIESSLI